MCTQWIWFHDQIVCEIVCTISLYIYACLLNCYIHHFLNEMLTYSVTSIFKNVCKCASFLISHENPAFCNKYIYIKWKKCCLSRFLFLNRCISVGKYKKCWNFWSFYLPYFYIYRHKILFYIGLYHSIDNSFYYFLRNSLLNVFTFWYKEIL